MIYFKSEKDLEDVLMEDEDWFRSSFEIWDYKLLRQVEIKPYGIMDILALNVLRDPDGHEIELMVEVFELKNAPICASHVCQLARYKSYFDMLREHTCMDISITCHLIGSKTLPTDNDLCFLLQSVDWLRAYEFNLCPKSGIQFEKVEGWVRRGGVTQDTADEFIGSLPFEMKIHTSKRSKS